MILKNKFFRILLGLIILALIYYVWLIVKIYNQINIDEAQKAEAVVVLGASQWNNQPSPVLKTRLDYALSLYNQGLSSKIILTGGVGKGEIISESQVGKDYLIEKGVDSQNIFIEEKGHTSWQSLNQVAQILKEQNLNSIILVSDGFHMMRLNKMAKDLGIQAYGSRVIESPISKSKITEFKYIVREAWVYILYLLFEI
ncbi:MAG: YdcF family protein [bacterium]|nr:YdcF family protein [bacterium]